MSSTTFETETVLGRATTDPQTVLGDAILCLLYKFGLSLQNPRNAPIRLSDIARMASSTRALVEKALAPLQWHSLPRSALVSGAPVSGGPFVEECYGLQERAFRITGSGVAFVDVVRGGGHGDGLKPTAVPKDLDWHLEPDEVEPSPALPEWPAYAQLEEVRKVLSEFTTWGPPATIVDALREALASGRQAREERAAERVRCTQWVKYTACLLQDAMKDSHMVVDRLSALVTTIQAGCAYPYEGSGA